MLQKRLSSADLSIENTNVLGGLISEIFHVSVADDT